MVLVVVVIATYWVQLVVVVVVTGDDNYNSSSDYSGIDCVEAVIKTVSLVTVVITCRTGSAQKRLLQLSFTSILAFIVFSFCSPFFVSLLMQRRFPLISTYSLLAETWASPVRI